MNMPTRALLPDVQSSHDHRNIPIQRVGVKSVTYPVNVATPDGSQPTVAVIDMYVALPAHVKGTHMSRFLEVLEAFNEPLSPDALTLLMATMLKQLDAESGSIEMRMPYFVRKTAPVSGVASLLDHQLTLSVEQVNGTLSVTQQITTPVTSLCPCSKEISLYGAHNQRSHVSIATTLAPGARMSVQELIDIAETSASCQLWGLLKRADEKYVTERAYENPKFVEDLVRDVAMTLSADPRVARYEVSSENFESIHNHSAFAWLSGP
jgi:GTP cyclohydrolase I